MLEQPEPEGTLKDASPAPSGRVAAGLRWVMDRSGHWRVAASIARNLGASSEKYFHGACRVLVGPFWPATLPVKKVGSVFGKFGGRTWARTKDPLIKSQLLYQLSYASAPYWRGAPIAAVRRASSPFLGKSFGHLAESMR